MENFLKKSLVPLSILAAMTAHWSDTKAPFVPVASPNPTVDDYSHVANMESRNEWGSYNVHDPAMTKVGDTYYMYSTDAIYFPPRPRPEKTAEGHQGGNKMRKREKPLGFAQMRRSKDLVNWEFIGWALPEIPKSAVEFVTSRNDGHGATNVWAPYMVDNGNGIFHLYFCVSAFGKNTSVIGLATATSPEGPWEYQGPVVETDATTPMNAIDPTVITADGRRFMHYGSYFGGLYCVEIDPATGFTKNEKDLGKLVARRANYLKDNLEAPEIIYNPELKQYFLFGSYDPLMTTYNVRVCRSSNPDGPFIDFHGKEMADTTDNFPLLTAPYNFSNHPGWVGTAHCGVIADGEGNYYMAHQGRLASNSGMMVLHLRQMFFTPEGWPVVSPERYTATEKRVFTTADMAGKWEIIRLHEPTSDRKLEAGQILWGEGDLMEGERNLAATLSFATDGSITRDDNASSLNITTTDPLTWNFDEPQQMLTLQVNGEILKNLITFAGHDWEREQDTILFTGLDSNGRAVWGKRIE